MSLPQERIIIMGGSSGIGFAAARQLATAGATVTITGRDRDKLEAALDILPGGVRAESVDATDVQQVQPFFSRLGSFDHLILALSGNKGAGSFRELELSELREGFEAKFWPHISCAQAALATLRTDGSVTFIGAASAHGANPGTAGLAALNAAVEALVPVLAAELAPLRVNGVSPGVINTPWWDFLPAADKLTTFEDFATQTPVGRVGTPEDVAQVIALLLGNTFMTGQVLVCDGGLG